jgi:hypothetical protein
MSIYDINYIAVPDYNYNNYYGYCPIEHLHNTILIPINTYPEFKNIQIGNKIIIKNKGTNNSQSIINDAKLTNIFGIEYLYFNIAIGIRTSGVMAFIHKDFSLIYNNKEYSLSLIFDQYLDRCKLLVSNLVLSDNYLFAFNNNDKIQVLIDNQSEYGIISEVSNKYNYYSPMRYSTSLELDPAQNIELLSILNSYQGFENAQIRSLITKPNMTKGSIRLNIINHSRGVFNYKIICTCKENNYSNIFYANDVLDIKDLTSGTYYIKIIDNDDQRPYRINKEINNKEVFTINILDSLDKEKDIIINSLINNGKINKSSIKNLPRLLKLT